MGDVLDLINVLAYDGEAEPGLRWSLSQPKPWVFKLDAGLRKSLSDLIVHDQLAKSKTLDLTTNRRLTLVLIAVVLDFTPRQPLTLVDCIMAEELLELAYILEESYELPAWLKDATNQS